MKTHSSVKNIWDYIVPERLKRFGPDIADADKRAVWSQAIFYGGNTLRLWNEAVPLKMVLLAACAADKGQKIAVIGKYGVDSGLVEALHSLIGPQGRIMVEEMAPRAIEMFQKIRLNGDKNLTWKFDYLDSIEDSSLDRVILFGSPGHVNNWETFIRQIDRVLCPGGRIVIADAPWGGKEFIDASRMVIHFRGMVEALLSGIGINEQDLPTTGIDDLTSWFQPYLAWSRHFSYRGMYLFYGQKPGGNQWDNVERLPSSSTAAVSSFLTEKPFKSPWDFLAEAEIKALGKEITEVDSQKKWGRVITFGASMDWMHENEPGIWEIMYQNLQVKPGYKVLVIGEFLERMFIPELRKRVGEKGEIAAFDTGPLHRVVFEKLWQEGQDTYIPERHQWDYPWADQFPDRYFDLLWLPHGVHHARSWTDIAPRLLRVLKPGGQVMMAEGRFNHPLFHAALNISGLMNCIAEKIYWASHVTFKEMPDYTTEQLAQVFHDSLRDIFKLESSGWLVFWGYKK